MRNHPEVGRVLGCDVYGGYDVKACAADQFTRSLHSIETLYTIMGPGCVSVRCTSTPLAESITGTWDDGHAFPRPGHKEPVKSGKPPVLGAANPTTSTREVRMSLSRFACDTCRVRVADDVRSVAFG